MIKCLLTELGRAGRENIWPEVMAYRPSAARSVRLDPWPSHSVDKCIERTYLQLCLVTWPLNESEAGVDLVMIQTSLLFLC